MVQSIQIERWENTIRMNIAKFSLEQRVSAQAKRLIAEKSPSEDQQVLSQKVLIELTHTFWSHLALRISQSY